MVTLSDMQKTSIWLENDQTTNKTSASISSGYIMSSGSKDNENWIQQDDEVNRI